jgi:biopolymer transport protein ExbD
MARNKKKRRGVMVPVASMGDIAFLLIIFFLLLSEFNKDQVAELMLPKSEHVEKLEGKPIAKVDIDKDGVIYVDSEIVSDAKEVQERLTRKLQDTVSDEQRHIQFKCDMEIGKPVFEPVLQAIAEAGGIIEAVGKRNNE